LKKFRFKLGFFGLIVRNFTIFTLSSFFLIIGLLVFLTVAIYFNVNSLSDVSGGDYKEDLVQGKYEEIQAALTADGDRHLYVLDGESFIFKSDKKPLEMDLDHLHLIPDTALVHYIGVDRFGQEGQGYTTIIYTTGFDDEYGRTLITDDNRVIYSNMFQEETFTSEEILMIMGDYDDTYSISKTVFESKEGRQLIAVFLDDKEYFDTINVRWEKIIIVGLIVFGIVYLLFILLFIRSIDRKVKKPLNLLTVAIKNLRDKKANPIHYKGPREFERIMTQFDLVSQDLRVAEQREQAMREERQRLLSDISHDLKTPITIIQGFTKAIVDDKVDALKKKQYIQAIHDKSKYMGDLVDQLSLYNKMNHPDFKLNLEDHNLIAFCRNYLINIYDSIESQGFELVVDLPDEDLVARFDPLQLNRVFNNIIYNSVKYNEAKTKIHFTVTSDQEAIYLEIYDDGIGISDDLKARLFEPFTVEDPSRSTESSGLGLAIVKKLLVAHDIDIQIMTRPLGLGYQLTLKRPDQL